MKSNSVTTLLRLQSCEIKNKYLRLLRVMGKIKRTYKIVAGPSEFLTSIIIVAT